MDALTADISEVSPTDPVAAEIVARHLAVMRASSPPCSGHAMEAGELAGAGARFFVAVADGRAVAMGAVKRIAKGHAELKSMHVLEDWRGRGLAEAVLAACLDAAREIGAERLSLETGSREVFAPARAFYARQGFAECGPFGDYRADPESVFMARAL